MAENKAWILTNISESPMIAFRYSICADLKTKLTDKDSFCLSELSVESLNSNVKSLFHLTNFEENTLFQSDFFKLLNLPILGLKSGQY